MEVAAYVQARYGRLLEYAVELGAPEGQAAEYVDEVLVAQRRRIRRAADPDPLVRDALARAIEGRRDHGRSAMVAVVIVLVLIALIGGAALLFRPKPMPLPTLVGYQAAEAEALLRADGWDDVTVRQGRNCEPPDLVTGLEPAAGTLVRPGAQVVVQTSIPFDCGAEYVWRSSAWIFVRWARGLAAAPDFADPLVVIVDGRPADLDEVKALLETTAAQAGTGSSGMPLLDADAVVPPASYCGIAQPAAVVARRAVRFTLDPQPDGRASDCPLTVDLYRNDRAVSAPIDTVVVYTAVDADD